MTAAKCGCCGDEIEFDVDIVECCLDLDCRWCEGRGAYETEQRWCACKVGDCGKCDQEEP